MQDEKENAVPLKASCHTYQHLTYMLFFGHQLPDYLPEDEPKEVEDKVCECTNCVIYIDYLHHSKQLSEVVQWKVVVDG